MRHGRRTRVTARREDRADEVMERAERRAADRERRPFRSAVQEAVPDPLRRYRATVVLPEDAIADVGEPVVEPVE